ncbi:MAG: hypothetical protein E7013_00710 [Alphaproteobacteria bacterium]|nr:hypothetical protein [Alphaproteobacteria bacterium]
MVQNKKNYANRPATRPATHAANTAAKHVEKKENTKCCCGDSCKCDSSCKCGCQSTNVCGSQIACGIMTLIGCLFIAGSILVLHRVDEPKTTAQVAKFDEKAVAAWVKANPKAIIDSVDAYYKKQQAGRAAAPKVADAAMIKEIVEDKTNSVMGNPKGTFVMIEFFDYNCGYCKMMNKKMAEAIKKSDNIRWILIDTPIFGDKSEVISRYALAAGKQGKFAEFHGALETAKDKTEAGLKELGKTLGLDVAKLEKDANSDAIKKKIEKNKEYTKKLQMGGVPMFIIDGNIQGGAFQDDKMEEYIKKANEMKKAKK